MLSFFIKVPISFMNLFYTTPLLHLYFLAELTTAPKCTKIVGKVGGVYGGHKTKECNTSLIRCFVFIGVEVLKKDTCRRKSLVAAQNLCMHLGHAQDIDPKQRPVHVAKTLRPLWQQNKVRQEAVPPKASAGPVQRHPPLRNSCAQNV